MAKPSKPDLLTAADYANRIGVSGARLTVLFRKGMPHREGTDWRGRACKMLDPVACDRWRAANLVPKLDGSGRVRGLVGGASPTPGGADRISQSAMAIQASKARREEVSTEREEIRLLKDKGSLVDRRAALAVQRQFVAAVGTGIDRMPADNATVIAALLRCTEHEAFQALRRVADRMKDDLARYADEAAERARAAPG